MIIGSGEITTNGVRLAYQIYAEEHKQEKQKLVLTLVDITTERAEAREKAFVAAFQEKFPHTKLEKCIRVYYPYYTERSIFIDGCEDEHLIWARMARGSGIIDDHRIETTSPDEKEPTNYTMPHIYTLVEALRSIIAEEVQKGLKKHEQEKLTRERLNSTPWDTSWR